jgi:hypothetical protein
VCDSGQYDSGNCDLGKCDAGKCVSGKCDSGNCGSGRCDAGKCDSGKFDSGKNGREKVIQANVICVKINAENLFGPHSNNVLCSLRVHFCSYLKIIFEICLNKFS